jgi:8-oxo-dGTP pyrophosphatase MutT (NUDIX family)
MDSNDMMQKYKVYCGSTTLWITNEIPTNFSGSVIAMEEDGFEVKAQWERIHDQGLEVIWQTSDVPVSWSRFQSVFRQIHAAGGRVVNEDNDVLFIYRRDKWDLAKGKVDKGETLEEAAVREVMEECGLESLKLESFLLATYHVYEIKGKWALKSTFWYQMWATKNQELHPQVEEDITDMKWISSENNSWRANTFASIIDVIDAEVI